MDISWLDHQSEIVIWPGQFDPGIVPGRCVIHSELPVENSQVQLAVVLADTSFLQLAGNDYILPLASWLMFIIFQWKTLCSQELTFKKILLITDMWGAPE